LLDIAMGSAARFAAGSPVTTLDMHVSFIAPGEDVLTAEGRVVRTGGSIIFTEAEARGAIDEVVAKASGVFKTRKPARV
jgi:acyl-coenzyme A thioesterase PaaI-like protein